MEVAELDASTFLTREPYHLSSLADDLLKIVQKQKGFQNTSQALKTGFVLQAADAINAANTEAVVPLA